MKLRRESVIFGIMKINLVLPDLICNSSHRSYLHQSLEIMMGVWLTWQYLVIDFPIFDHFQTIFCHMQMLKRSKLYYYSVEIDLLHESIVHIIWYIYNRYKAKDLPYKISITPHEEGSGNHFASWICIGVKTMIKWFYWRISILCSAQL